ncbi:MAG: chemotaxis protein CheW [Candidatus Delongbacteria bacterium]
MAEQQQYCTFFLNNLFLGVDVRLVQEVIRSQHLTHVPLATREISGLINLRGQIVTAIDLRRRLNLPDRPAGQAPMNVVVRNEDSIHSLLVDLVGDVVTVEDSTFEKPPDTLDPALRGLITGAHKLQDRLLLVLDVKQAVQLDHAGATLREPVA